MTSPYVPRVLPGCFKPRELEYLEMQPQFQKAVAAMLSLDDLEGVVWLGQELLDARFALPQIQMVPRIRLDQRAVYLAARPL